MQKREAVGLPFFLLYFLRANPFRATDKLLNRVGHPFLAVFNLNSCGGQTIP